jgi:antagonist of KipI
MATTTDDGVSPVRVLPCPTDRFSDDALAQLESAPYTVTPESNRMGFRLQGPAIRHREAADIISDVTPLGTLQVPASGQPVLLMADRQTTGGYPKLATAITADLSIAAQLAPGDAVRFQVCTRREAMAALLSRERMLMALEGAIGS